MSCVSANNAFHNDKELYKFGLSEFIFLLYEKIKRFRVPEAQ